MGQRIRRTVTLLFVITLGTTTALAQFSSFETSHLRLLYYTKAHEFVVPHLARCFENSFLFHSRLLDYTPPEKTTLVLEDFGDYGGGSANTVPFNLIEIGIAPFSYVYETMPPLERMTMMMNHELVHIFTMDKPSAGDRVFRSLFCGKVAPVAESPLSMVYFYLTNPRWVSPRWFIEGSAVFMETWMGGGLGRALGAYDEMVFRTMVHDSSYFYDMVGLESEATKTDFQVGAASYLYGTRFLSYLALLYGPENLVKWCAQREHSKGYFASEFEDVYGMPLEEEWSRWISWEHEWQRRNLDSLRRNPITQFTPVAHVPLGSVSRAFYEPTLRKLYVAINYPGQTAHVAAISVDNGSIENICDIRGAALFYVTSLAYDPGSQTLFYTSDNNKWRDLNAVDVTTGRSKLLMKDARIGDLAFNRADKSLWGIRHFNGISTLVRIPYPYEEWNQIHSWDYGRDIFDLDISPDGSKVSAALAEISGRQLLISMDTEKLVRGDSTCDVLFDFENSTPANFVFSDDGKYLFGSSYYSGVSNIVRYDVERKEMEWLSNCETGFFRPVPTGNDSMIVFDYTGKGFLPVKIALRSVENVGAIHYLGQAVVERHPVLKSWALRPPSSITLDSTALSNGDYSPVKHIEVASAYPIIEGFKDYLAYGMRVNLGDPTGLNNLDLTASYSPNAGLAEAERAHLAFNYRFWPWKITGSVNYADFYDLFGPTKLSRKGYSLGLEYSNFFIFDEPETLEYDIAATGYGGLERLPEYQNVGTTYRELYHARGRIRYKNSERSLGAIEDEKGMQTEVVADGSIVNGHAFPRMYASTAYGILLPLDHSSIWLRASTGSSMGTRQEPFSNFYFGGFGNNWVDHGAISRYREYYSFPGVVLNGIGGENYAKLQLEWTLPPVRFRRFGIPNFYCTWARIALFSSAIVSPLAAQPDRFVDLGGQIDFNLVLFSHLNSTLSFGYAGAVEIRQRPTKEFMISLKVL